MSPSTPPPPETATRALFPRPPNSPHPTPLTSRVLPSNPNPNYPQLAPRPLPPPPIPTPHQGGDLYPSAGRGFLLSRPPASSRFVVPYHLGNQGSPLFARPNHFTPVLLGSAGNVMPAAAAAGVVKGIPVHTKVGPPSGSISDINGHKDLRDRNKDETFAIIKDRKVRLTDNASLYTLCRSWLRNSFPEEIQPQYLDTVKSLPRPSPAAAQVVDSPDKTAGDKEDEDEEKDSVEHLSEKELLQKHIKRAKRVRSRLREERLQRITRYKTRLALLLPPMVEQHFKNESAPSN